MDGRVGTVGGRYGERTVCARLGGLCMNEG